VSDETETALAIQAQAQVGSRQGCGRRSLSGARWCDRRSAGRLSPQRSRSWRRAADWCACRSGRPLSDQRELRRSPAAIWAANTRQGIVWPRRNSPVRGVAPTTMPNQRPRMSQPSILTSTPVSSPRHNSHRSSLFTMPATAARWGRAPASRRAATRTSAGVRTLTTPAWARAAPDDHRGRGPRKASHATATASACHRRATASGRRKCRISRLQFRA